MKGGTAEKRLRYDEGPPLSCLDSPQLVSVAPQEGQVRLCVMSFAMLSVAGISG
jgi:hypothetical protein